jgi:hypothetical protein
MLPEGFGYVFDFNDGHILTSRIIANRRSSGFDRTLLLRIMSGSDNRDKLNRFRQASE